MKRSRYTEEQIIGILKEQEAGTPVAELCRKHGMSDATFYTWKSKYGGLEVRGETAAGFGNGERQAEAAVGGRDARQRRVEGPAWKKMVTPAAGREAVAHLRGR